MLETLDRAAELQLRAGQMLCLYAERARIFSGIGTSCLTAGARFHFREKARRTIFVVDCWSVGFHVTDLQRNEF